MDKSLLKEIKIVTVDSLEKDVLEKKTEDIKENEFHMVHEISEKLFLALKPHLPAAGLAAPQIGISKSVFIYSYDRDPKNLEVVINPAFIPIGDNKVEGWEGCLSTTLCEKAWQIAKVSRYEKIKVTYLNLNGEKIEKIIDGFAAKVFQHEYDHLEGIVNIYRSDATIKEFNNKEAMFDFLKGVKKEDSSRYNSPNHA